MFSEGVACINTHTHLSKVTLGHWLAAIECIEFVLAVKTREFWTIVDIEIGLDGVEK